MFLAIAVDNLANATEMTKREAKEAAEKEAIDKQEAMVNMMPTQTEIMDADGDLLDLYDLTGMEPPQVNICPPSPSKDGKPKKSGGLGLMVPSSR